MSDILTLDQLLEELTTSRHTFAKWRAAGSAPRAIKLPNGQLRFRRADVDAWLAEQMEAAA